MTLGKFTVRTALRNDNPAFPKYQIFLDGKLIGTQFSLPGLSDCEWHERQSGIYATQSEAAQSQPPMHAKEWRERRGRKTNAERARLASLPDEEPVF